MLDTSRIGAWADLPFFNGPLADVSSKIGNDFLPPSHAVFRALEMTQPDDVKVIILGQDPYHTGGKADGLAFSIPDQFGGRLDSLGNIFIELSIDMNVDRRKTSLDDWANQGILLLNTALTVAPGQAKSHAKVGWDKLVIDVLQSLSHKPRAGVFWGRPAQGFAKHLQGDHLKIETAHPSPLSVHRGFFGSRPFSKINQWLMDQSQQPIDWAEP